VSDDGLDALLAYRSQRSVSREHVMRYIASAQETARIPRKPPTFESTEDADRWLESRAACCGYPLGA